jgi:hypothetical protein
MASTGASKSASFDPPYYIRGCIWVDHDDDGAFEPNSPDFDHYALNYAFQYHRSDDPSWLWRWVQTTDTNGTYEIEIDDADVETTIRFPFYQTDFNLLHYTSMEQGVSTWMGTEEDDYWMEYCGVFAANEHHSANFIAYADY